MTRSNLPNILIIDDLFGRTHGDRRNEERANLCGQYLIEDVTGDEVNKSTAQKIKQPIAQAVFHRGQIPKMSTEGDFVVNDLEGVIQVIQEGWHDSKGQNLPWALVILDLCFYQGRVTAESNHKVLGMPEGLAGDDNPQKYFGLTILKAVHERFPQQPVIILSSKDRQAVSKEFSYAGALGFLPREDQKSPELLQDYILRHALLPDPEEEIIGVSKDLLIALRAARRIALTRRNVLIRGEQGTGKELIARYIQRHSRASISLVVVNSSILTKDLFASELFGIRAGTATQVQEREGLILKAHSGNLFFDEIGDMRPEVQAGLLRVVEDRQITPVGSREAKSVDVRFISATNRDIEARAAKEEFRYDLLERLREGGTIFLSPLRERKSDIPLLVEKFVRDAEKEFATSYRREIVPEIYQMCSRHGWTGNLRELRNCIFAAVQDHPDVEYLVPPHLSLTTSSAGKLDSSNDRMLQEDNGTAGSRAESIDDVIDTLTSFRFASPRQSDLLGQLKNIEGAYAQFVARYLLEVLEATSKSSEENPEGKIMIHPAVKVMTGNGEISASAAADLVKRLLKISPESIIDLLRDPKLQKALETAQRLRPPRKKSTKRSE